MSRMVSVILLSAIVTIVSGAAFAATPPVIGTVDPGLGAAAARAVTVTLLSAVPGGSANAIASVEAQMLWAGAPAAELERASFAQLEVAGHSAVFAVDRSAASQGRLVLHVAGAPGATAANLAPLSVVASDLYEASQGLRPVVLLARGSGAGAVTFALYDPSQPFGGAGVAGADQATVWIDGAVGRYPVRPGSANVRSLVIASSGGAGRLRTLFG